MSSIQETRVVGSWQECSRKDCNQVFFRYPYGHKYYSISDKTGACPLCIHTIKVRNGTLGGRSGNISEFVHHKSNDARPESGTL